MKKLPMIINEAYQWYEDKKVGLGDAFLKAIREKIKQIDLNPETYSSKSKKDYRECRVDVFPFVIVYKIYKAKNEIFVSSVHHLKKHPRNKYRK